MINHLAPVIDTSFIRSCYPRRKSSRICMPFTFNGLQAQVHEKRSLLRSQIILAPGTRYQAFVNARTYFTSPSFVLARVLPPIYLFIPLPDGLIVPESHTCAVSRIKIVNRAPRLGWDGGRYSISRLSSVN